MRLGLIWLAALSLHAAIPPELEKHLNRLAEEAEIFAQMAPKMIGQEALEQVAAQPPPRFQPRGEKPPLLFKTRHIVSEYGFSTFQDDNNLHEIRQVLNVDGRKVKEKGKLRETLSMGMQGDADRTKKKLLKEFESYGLRDAATDFGQVILMFTKRQLENYTFTSLRTQFIGADKVRVIAFQQKDGDTSMTVFEGKRVVHHPLKGELFLRDSDGVPVRITVDASRKQGERTLRHYAVIDYQLSGNGVVLPAAVNYAESTDGKVFVENRFHYSDFRMFGASSELKFSVEEIDPGKKPLPQPEKKKK